MKQDTTTTKRLALATLGVWVSAGGGASQIGLAPPGMWVSAGGLASKAAQIR